MLKHWSKLTLFLVVVMAQAALVSHMKLAEQFWYRRKRGPEDCTETECDTADTTSEGRLHPTSGPRTTVPLEQTRWMRVV